MLALNCSLEKHHQVKTRAQVFLEQSNREGEIPVSSVVLAGRCAFIESRTLEVVRKMGGNFLLKLNIDSRPIANKYREGKVKRTLKRELKVPETARREANETSFLP